MKPLYNIYFLVAFLLATIFCQGQEGPLGEWPEFIPQGFITAPHPMDSNYQTHLYGDWGGIVGEEFLAIEDSMLKLLYHSYHETYLSEHALEQNIMTNWELGYSPVTFEKYTPLVKPGGPYPGPAWSHTDTPAYIKHPLSGDHILYNTVRPGTAHLNPDWDGIPGTESVIQVSTSANPPEIGVPFMQKYINALIAEYWWEEGWNNNGEIKGGLSEPTPVWVPHLGDSGMVRLFYRGLNAAPGSYWNWRISYADSEDGITNWIKKGTPTFDPSDPTNPAYRWSKPYPQGFSFRGAWQAHCTGDTLADGVHMILCVSNQNYAGYGHLAYYWSPDWGDTWIGHPDNPIIAPGQFPYGVPAQGFQRTPAIVVDEKHNRYILVYNAGHDVEERWKRRTYIATASRPTVSIDERKNEGRQIILVNNYPNPFYTKTQIGFEITKRVDVKISVFDTRGQLVECIIDKSFGIGKHTVSWNAEEFPTGIYYFKLQAGQLNTTGKMIKFN